MPFGVAAFFSLLPHHFYDLHPTDLLEKLGKHTLSGGCLHIKKLADVDLEVLKELIARGVAATT
nr:DUF1801 domain-containing protein [Armatimonas sp.]